MTTARPTPLDDRSLIRDVQGGSASALAGLYERTASVLYPLALRISGNSERASCVLEELFDEIWRDRASLSAALGIPLGSMIRRCRDLALSQVCPEVEPRRPMTSTPGVTPAVAPPMDHGPLVPRQTACDAVEALPERDRMALEEAFFRGTGARDIASMVGTPTSDAEGMLRSALVRFRNHIDAPDGADSSRGGIVRHEGVDSGGDLDSLAGIEARTGTEP